MNEKLVVLGFDGMDIKLLRDAMEQRDMPNFEKLEREGIIENLESCHPPVTIPAWITIFTGKNPGKLGVFHFQQLDTETGSFVPNTVDQYAGTYFWDTGVKSSLVFIPGTSPVYEINGRIVEGVPGPKDFNTYPENLKEELVTEEDVHDLTRDYDSIFDKTWSMYETRKKVIHDIAENYDQEFLAAMLKPTDSIPHHTQDKERLLDVYEKMDEDLGYFLDHVEEQGADLIIASDHGTSEVDTVFFPNTWLYENGYLQLSEEGESVKSSKILELANFLINLGLKKPLEKAHSAIQKFSGKSFKKSKHSVAEQVDWNRSKAISHLVGAPPTTGINLNEDLLSQEELEKVKVDIIEDLSQEEYIEWVKPREEVFEGDRVDELPHLVVRGKDNVMIKSNIHPSTISHFKNFGHGYHGVFGAYGPSIKQNSGLDAELVDIAPTLLHLLGKPVPEDMDGKVLDIFKSGREVEKGEPISVQRSSENEVDEEEVKNRLEEMGYMRD